MRAHVAKPQPCSSAFSLSEEGMMMPAQKIQLQLFNTTAHLTMAPRIKGKKSQDELASLFVEMERHMVLDRILEARKVVDEILQLSTSESSRISLQQQEEMNHIIQEFNHVKEFLGDLQSALRQDTHNSRQLRPR